MLPHARILLDYNVSRALHALNYNVSYLTMWLWWIMWIDVTLCTWYTWLVIIVHLRQCRWFENNVMTYWRCDDYENVCWLIEDNVCMKLVLLIYLCLYLFMWMLSYPLVVVWLTISPLKNSLDVQDQDVWDVVSTRGLSWHFLDFLVAWSLVLGSDYDVSGVFIFINFWIMLRILLSMYLWDLKHVVEILDYLRYWDVVLFFCEIL